MSEDHAREQRKAALLEIVADLERLRRRALQIGGIAGNNCAAHLDRADELRFEINRYA